MKKHMENHKRKECANRIMVCHDGCRRSMYAFNFEDHIKKCSKIEYFVCPWEALGLCDVGPMKRTHVYYHQKAGGNKHYEFTVKLLKSKKCLSC